MATGGEDPCSSDAKHHHELESDAGIGRGQEHIEHAMKNTRSALIMPEHAPFGRNTL